MPSLLVTGLSNYLNDFQVSRPIIDVLVVTLYRGKKGGRKIKGVFYPLVLSKGTPKKKTKEKLKICIP